MTTIAVVRSPGKSGQPSASGTHLHTVMTMRICAVLTSKHRRRIVSCCENVDSSLLQCFYQTSDLPQRIETPGFQPSALCFEVITAQFVEQCRSDLAACTVLNTKEKTVFFTGRILTEPQHN